jgi:hypothetical protein
MGRYDSTSEGVLDSLQMGINSACFHETGTDSVIQLLLKRFRIYSISYNHQVISSETGYQPGRYLG